MRYVASGLCFCVVIKKSFVFLCHRLQTNENHERYAVIPSGFHIVYKLIFLSLQVISRHVELQGKSPPLEQQEQVWTDGVQTKLFLQSVLLLG